MDKTIKILKIILLSLASILITIIIIQKIIPKNTDNTSKYISWCRTDYDGYSYPSKEFMRECVNNYNKIEKSINIDIIKEKES